ncbi:MAG TPA: L-rhamnose mutarotase [Pedobacter sp.]|uniref:L-rhamnose mutarotase n=1 Tax=Pedobacter sp. TaxID=1411316 RepID=UPI002B854416|nr:L-rhamnose mutarotase [Pedobacter sp.]HMI04557.1 L-rhamnose mutarotase [Pedobacter sp.]
MMRKPGIYAVLVMLLFAACQANQTEVPVKRFGSVTGLKPEKMEYYKKLHANAWPEVLKKIKQCNIRNYSIYLQKIDSSYYLFSYFEYVGKDFDADMKKMADDPNTQKWWKETDPCQQPLPETAAKKQIWTNMEEVFHTD